MPEQHPHTSHPDEQGGREPFASKLRTHSASDILAAGGADRYFAEQGIDNRRTSFAGLLDLTEEETRQLLADLRRSEYKNYPLEDPDAEPTPDEATDEPPQEAEL